MPVSLNQQRILIVGAGATGLSVARFLQSRGIAFDIADTGAALSDDAAASMDPALQRALAWASRVHTEFSPALFCEYTMLVLSPGIPRRHPAVQAALQDGVQVIGDIELFAQSVNAPVIAVTGSNGKSTVVSWIADVLNSSDTKAVPCGNIGLPALDSLSDTADCYVLELSSYQLESCESLKPLSATVLNVSDDHLDRYDSIEHYAAVKRRVLSDANHVVVNEDDPRTWPHASNDATANQQQITACGDAGQNATAIVASAGVTLADVTLKGSEYLHSGQVVNAVSDNYTRWHVGVNNGAACLCQDGEALIDQSRLSVPGDHNVLNALAVLALIEPLGLDRDAVLRALPRFRGLAHRTELLGEYRGVRWYNDSKGTNVDACIKAIAAMPGPVVLLAGGIGKGADFSELASTVSRYVKALVLIGRDRQQIGDALGELVETVYADSLSDAVQHCVRLACAGDVVLLSPACSSFDMFANFEDRGCQFAAAFQQVQVA